MKKSDLEKSLPLLQALARGTNPRAQELWNKSQSGTPLSAAEKDELIKSLGGGDSKPLADEVVAGLDGDDRIAKSVEVSDYLAAQHDGLKASLQTLAKAVDATRSDEQSFRVAASHALLGLTEAVTEQGALIKSLVDRLGAAAQEPARAPRSRPGGGAEPVSKSMSDPNAQPKGGNTLSKSAALNAMMDMLEKGVSVEGDDVAHAITKYETTNLMSPEMRAAVLAHAGVKQTH